MWKNLRTDKISDSPYYSTMALDGSGMHALREMFPDAEANEMNCALFSTSGIHGTYNTIEEAEQHLLNQDGEGCAGVTFLILQPRIVCLRYGECDPENADDIAFLKKLRSSSHAALAGIGVASPPA